MPAQSLYDTSQATDTKVTLVTFQARQMNTEYTVLNGPGNPPAAGDVGEYVVNFVYEEGRPVTAAIRVQPDDPCMEQWLYPAGHESAADYLAKNPGRNRLGVNVGIRIVRHPLDAERTEIRGGRSFDPGLEHEAAIPVEPSHFVIDVAVAMPGMSAQYVTAPGYAEEDLEAIVSQFGIPFDRTFRHVAIEELGPEGRVGAPMPEPQPVPEQAVEAAAEQGASL